MPVTTEQYQRILARLTVLEESVNDIFVALDRLVSVGAVNQLITTLTTDLEDLQNTVDALEARVEDIETEPAL